MGLILQIVKNLNRADRTIIGVCALFLFCTLTLLFYDDALMEFYNFGESNRTPVAVITSSKNDIRRKRDQSVVWSPVKSKSALFDDDTIFSGDASDLEFQFTADKTKIQLGAQTLVKLTQDAHQNNNLAVLHGRVSVGLGARKTLYLNLGGKTLEIKSKNNSDLTSIEVIAGDTAQDSPQLNVLSGEVDVKVVGSLEPAQTITSEKPYETPNKLGRVIASTEKPIEIAPTSISPEPYVEPEPQIQLAPELATEQPTATEFEDFTRNNTLRFSPLVGASKYSGKPNSGGQTTRVSKLDVGGSAEWTHKLNDNLEFGFLFGFLQTDLDQHTKQIANGVPVNLFHFGAALDWHLFDRFTVTSKIEESQKLFITSATSTLLQLEKLWIPSLVFKIDYALYKDTDFKLKLGLLGGVELPGSADTYSVKLGTTYGGGVSMEYLLSKSFSMHGELSESIQSQSTSILNQTRTAITLELGVSYHFGRKK